MQSIVDQAWPETIPRTEPAERESSRRYEAGIRKTKRALKKEMQRLDVTEWELYDSSNSQDPGVVVEWAKDGDDYVAACDHYTDRKQNLRALYTWINETRMRQQRHVETVGENFAAARKALPDGTEDNPIPAGPGGVQEEPHEVLEVAPDASDEVVKSVARRKMADLSPDNNDGGDRGEYIRVQKAKEAMLDGE